MVNNLTIVILCVFLGAVQAGSDGKCRALVLSGGGDKAAYQAGAIIQLMDMLDPVETDYDVVFGISAGNLNAAVLATYNLEAREEFKARLMRLWEEVGFSNVLKFWKGGIAEGILFRSSLFDNKNLKDYLSKAVEGRSLERHFTIGTVDANHGRFVPYHYAPQEGLPEDLIESSLASIAIPGIFPPIKRGDKLLIDGGMIWSYDIVGAVNQCRDLGYEDDHIIVDEIILHEAHPIKNEDLKDMHTLRIAMRAQGMHSFYNKFKSYHQAISFFPEVNFRYTIAPSKSLSLIPLNFSHKHIMEEIEIGKQDAKMAVELGDSGYADALQKYYYQKNAGESPIFMDILSDALSQAKEVTE